MLGATLYLPEEWLTPRQRARAGFPDGRVRAETAIGLTADAQVRSRGFRSRRGRRGEFGRNSDAAPRVHRPRYVCVGVSYDIKCVPGESAPRGPRDRLTGKGPFRVRCPPVPPEGRPPDRARVVGGDASTAAVRIGSRGRKRHHAPGARSCRPGHTRACDWRARKTLAPESGDSRGKAGGDRCALRWTLLRHRVVRDVSSGPSAMGNRTQSTKNSKTSSADHLKDARAGLWQRQVVWRQSPQLPSTQTRRRGADEPTSTTVRFRSTRGAHAISHDAPH